MGWWQKLFGPRERPEETLRLTRRAMDLLAEGKSDDEVQRTLFREGVSVQRAASLVAEVHRVQRMMRGHVVIIFVGLAMLCGTSASLAQQPADSGGSPTADTTRRSPADTTRRSAADTARPATSDTTARSADTAAARNVPPPVPAAVVPLDSALTGACAGVRSGGLAANLLMVVFRREATKKEATAIAKAIGGTLLETVPSGDPNAHYLRVPAEGDDQRLGLFADQVIRYQRVQQVGPAVCPAAPPAQAGQAAQPR